MVLPADPHFATVTRLHDLALGPDVVIAVTTAKRCSSLIPHDGPSSLKLHWLYSDATITKASHNSILSTDTAQVCPRMNYDGHQVYTKVMSVEPMPLHLSEDTPLAILDDTTTDYLRVNVGRFVYSWATGNFEDMSITHHTETGTMLNDIVAQALYKQNMDPATGPGCSSLRAMDLVKLLTVQSPSSFLYSTSTITASLAARTARQWSMDSGGAM